jgi:predicted secreted protein
MLKLISKHMVLLTLLLIFLVQPVLAEDKAYYDRVTLSAQAEADVENDTLVVVMTAQQQGTDVAKLSAEVNQLMSQALKRSKKVSAVEVQTLGYQTNPVYEKQHLTAWQVSQSLQLKSHDVQALSALVGELQEHLKLDTLSYQISPELRNKTEEAMIGKAIAAFSKRAQDITQQLGRKRYRLVSMQVNNSGIANQPPVQLMRARAEVRQAAPAIEAGKQTLTLTVSGIIELVVN